MYPVTAFLSQTGFKPRPDRRHEYKFYKKCDVKCGKSGYKQSGTINSSWCKTTTSTTLLLCWHATVRSVVYFMPNEAMVDAQHKLMSLVSLFSTFLSTIHPFIHPFIRLFSVAYCLYLFAFLGSFQGKVSAHTPIYPHIALTYVDSVCFFSPVQNFYMFKFKTPVPVRILNRQNSM